MLQLTDGRVVEMPAVNLEGSNCFTANISAPAATSSGFGGRGTGPVTTVAIGGYDGVDTAGNNYGQVSNNLQVGDYTFYPYQAFWGSYPVYVCQDKTKKAIEILKTLQKDKTLEVKSVSRFIELVEKIAAIL